MNECRKSWRAAVNHAFILAPARKLARLFHERSRTHGSYYLGARVQLDLSDPRNGGEFREKRAAGKVFLFLSNACITLTSDVHVNNVDNN